MTRSKLLLLGLAGVGLTVPTSAMAALDLTSLQELQVYVYCEQDCGYGSRAAYDACLADCGPTTSAWDLDLDGDIDLDDFKSALREYWGEPDCSGADASSPECADADSDGLYAWQEAALGTLDEPGNEQALCGDDGICGFAAKCTTANPSVPDAIPLDVGYCATRPGCSDPQSATCTAFHLELVEATDQELVVHVNFDHAPVGARILDLHIQYPKLALQLTNARALETLSRAGKTVEVRSSGYQTSSIEEIRVMVLGVNATRPIPNGPIVELVFSRLSPTATGNITFTMDDSIQRRSMAPNPAADGAASPLEADSMWGPPIQVDAATAGMPHLALYYSFDNDVLDPAPLVVPDEDTACALLYGCDDALRTQYSAMQLGVVEAETRIEGVSGPGVFLDGFSDHLELPVVFDDLNLDDDDFTLSFWFYHEGDGRGTGANEQVLFAHNTDTNRNGFGVVIKPATDGTFGLEWFEGDRLSTETGTARTPLGESFPDRTWLYLAAVLKGDGEGGATASIYVRHPDNPSLSSTTTVAVTEMVKGCLGTQQSLLKLVEPIVKREAIYYASSRNNLFGVARMDPNGMSAADVVRDPDSTSLDPDFHPGNRRVVFVSSRTGNYEVWIANLDGTKPVQVTRGFGNTSAGMFVRHPRWSPDGTAIVFEANAFSSSRYYNTLARGYQLYYVRYNPDTGRIEVPQTSGDPATVLDFTLIEQLDAFYRYTLTGTNTDNEGNRYNFTQAHWLGNDALIATRANERFDKSELVWFDLTSVPESYNFVERITQNVTLAQGEPGAELRLLAAGHRGTLERAFYAKELSSYESADASYAVGAPVWDGDQVTVTVTYTQDPDAFEEYCWDRNYNRSCDPSTENPDGLDGCTKLDCQPAELRDLYILFDDSLLEPVIDTVTRRIEVDASQWILDNKPVEGNPSGGLEVSSQYTSSGAFLTVQVLSETSALPIPQDTLLGTLKFQLKEGHVFEDVDLTTTVVPMVRRVHQELMLSESDQPEARVQLYGALFERVTSAAFSPLLDRIVVAGVQDARPVVATSDPLGFSARADETDPRVDANLHVVSSAPMRVEGLSWHSYETAFNCNWMGSYQTPSTGLFTDSFRGGLDEVRYFDSARSADALESEFERGTEWLRVAGRDGQVAPRNGQCSSHLECAPYEQCWQVDGNDAPPRCAPRPCSKQEDCGLEGSCRLMPVPVSQERPDLGDTLRFVCAVDCVGSSQCYEQECLNGPCVFCQAGTCAECQRMTGEFGIEYIEGCPDRNSFQCEEGSCISDCYSFENGVSRFLCDTATEYCRNGRCALLDWDWPDFSPATLSGMGEMLSVNHGGTPEDPLVYTEATAQFHSVEFEAYGVADYLGPPEVQVEVLDSGMYGGDHWISLGRVAVYNKTKTEAEDASRRYRVNSPYPFSAVRLRLVLPPYSNLNAAATGLGRRLAAQCDGDALNCAPREAIHPGSRKYLGYRIGIPEHVARSHVADISQLRDSDGLKFLYGGQPAVILQRLWVGSVASATEIALQNPCDSSNGVCVENRICPYDGVDNATDPSRVGQTPAPIADCSSSPGDYSLTLFPVDTAGFGLLNCIWNPIPEPGQSPASAAEIVVKNIPNAFFVDALTGRPNDGKHQETANACYVPIDVGGQVEYIPCFETLGSDPNSDPYNLESQAFRTLDIETFQSFGYEMETAAASGL